MTDTENCTCYFVEINVVLKIILKHRRPNNFSNYLIHGFNRFEAVIEIEEAEEVKLTSGEFTTKSLIDRLRRENCNRMKVDYLLSNSFVIK